MLDLSYTISVDLKGALATIDRLREQILTTPISPKAELKYRWDAVNTRVWASLSLADLPVSKSMVAKVLASPKTPGNDLGRQITGYKYALDHIRAQWVANAKPVTPGAIQELAELALPTLRIHRNFLAAETILHDLTDYLATQSEHPVIQAGIALSSIATSLLIPDDVGRVARLTAAAYLAKYGYDLRGLSSIEKYWANQEASYEVAIESIEKQQNLNHFLAFFAQSAKENFEDILGDLTASRFHSEFPASFWELTDRHKTILAYLDNPEATVTNKKVQKLCRVSQITASRDLAKLASLNLIFAHAKGRSTYYTRV